MAKHQQIDMISTTKRPIIELAQVYSTKKSIHRKGNSNGKNVQSYEKLGKFELKTYIFIHQIIHMCKDWYYLLVI